MRVVHRHFSNGTMSPEYRTWASMIAKCSNPNTLGWRWYGGRGISVCPEWRRFDQFFADIGPKPADRYRLEREDKLGDFEPSNASWVERKRKRAPAHDLKAA